MSRQELIKWLEYLDGKGLEVVNWFSIENEIEYLPSEE